MVGRSRKHDKHLPRRVYRKHGAFYYVARRDEVAALGKKWVRLGTTEEAMHAGLAKVIRKLGGTVDTQTLAAAWTRYQHTRAYLANAEATKADKRKLWADLEAAGFAEAHPDGVEPHHIATYLDTRPPVRANRAIALLSHIYTHLVRWGEAARNPCRGVSRNPETPRDVVVSDQTLVDWLAHARPVVRIVSELIYLTGRRKSDILSIRLDQIGDDEIAGVSPKTGKPFRIPITEDIAELLDEARELRRRKDGAIRLTEWLVCNRRGKAYTASGFSSLWDKDRATFAGQPFAPTDLRAKYADALEASGGDATKNLQHSSRQVTARHYLRRAQQTQTLVRLKK